jgi:hypothetical protein
MMLIGRAAQVSVQQPARRQPLPSRQYRKRRMGGPPMRLRGLVITCASGLKLELPSGFGVEVLQLRQWNGA